MKRINLLFSLVLCFSIISGTVLATTYHKGATNITGGNSPVKKAKRLSTISFTFTNNSANGLSYYITSSLGSYGGTVSPGKYVVINNVTSGSYTVNIVPTNGGGNPVPIDLTFNNGVYHDGDPGHEFYNVSIGNGSGQASSLTASPY